MSKLFNWAAARLVAAFALALPLAAMAVDYTGTDYEPWSYSAGCVAWRATESLFHSSTVVDVPADGVIVEENAYALGSSGHPWNVFASTVNSQPNANYTSPGVTLVYDVAGKKAASDAQFAPLSFGGMWVKVLQAEGVPYSITDNKTDTSDRKVELGATGASTYFKFDESFTFDRNSATKVLGTATVEIASGKTFTINQRADKGAAVDAGNTLVLKGEGTLAVVAGLSVSGTLDLSAATVPTISGDVTLVGGSTIILPENTVVDATHPFTVCTGTLSSSGDVVYVKIGGGDPVKAFVTVSGGAITAVSTLATYSATIDGDTVFSNIAWEKDGQAATIADMSTAILDISGSGVVTGLASAPAKVTLAAGVTLDATSIPAADFAAIVKSTSGTYRWTDNYPLAVPQNYTYEYVGGATDANQAIVSGELYFQNSGNLKTSGYIKFSNYWTGYTTATLDIISGQTVIDASNDKALRGTVTIRASAELVNSKTADALAYGAYTIVNVYGTLTMGSTRWTVGDNNTINMYGGTITGEGQSSNGALDFISGSALNVNETCEISASVRFRNALIPVTVAADKTLTLSGTIRGYGSNGEIGGVSKRGAGNLTFKSAPNNLPRGIEHKDGHLVFDTQDDVTITNTYNTAATDTRSLWYARQSNWKGTVKVTDLTGNLTWLTGAGNANSMISLQNVDNAYVIAAANSTYAIPGTLSIDGVTVFNNGSSGSTMSISNLTGSSQLVLAGWGGCSSVRYNLLNVDADWAGTLVVSNGITRAQGGTLTIGIGNIESANTNPGACVLPITNVALENAAGNVVYNLDNATLNGAEAELEVKSDGVYVRNNVTISVPVVANTTITVSVGGEPVAPATESGTTNTYSVASGATVTVTYTSDDYEVTGGTFEFTATDGYTVNTAEVVTKQYVASITVGETTTKYSTLQAAIDAVAQNKDIVLLVSETEGATVSREITFNVVPGEYTYGDIAAGGNYILTTTALEGKTRYSFAQAVIAVTINEVRTLYPMMTANAGIEAANAGPIGTTIEILSGNPADYAEYLPMFDLNTDTGVFTKVTDPVAAVYSGVVQVQVYRTLTDAFAAAESGQTIKVLAENTLTGEIAVSKNLTLDLNGFTVTGATGDVPMFNVGAVGFTITDTSEGKAGKAVSAGSKVILSGSACTFTLTAGTLESGDVPVYLYENLNSVLNINGGKIVCSKTSGYAVSILNGTVNMTAGEVNSTCSGFCMHNATVSGGTIKIGSGSSWEVFYDNANWATTTITGGTFNRDVSQYVSSGYEILNNGDGTYTVRKDNGWMYAAPGYWDYTGTWTEGAALDDDKVTFSDGATYSNRTASAGQLVTVAMTLSFDDVNDDEDGYEGAKAAIRLGAGAGETEGAYVFQLYTYEGSAATWKNATGFAPTVETDYNVLFVLDLTNKTYTASVVTGAGATTNALSVGGSTTIAFANQNNATPVQQIEFVGAGTVSSIEGSYEDAPAPVEFVENQVIGNVTLTDDQADWLNAQNNYAALAAKIATMTAAAFNDAYLLNLDILSEQYDGSYEFAVTGIAVGPAEVDVGDPQPVQVPNAVTVTVKLERKGALDGGINGILKLKGGNSLPASTFVVIGGDGVVIDDDRFKKGVEATIIFEKDSQNDAAFYQPVIESVYK